MSPWLVNAAKLFQTWKGSTSLGVVRGAPVRRTPPTGAAVAANMRAALSSCNR